MLWELGGKGQQVLHVSLFVFTNFERDVCILHLFFCLFRDGDFSSPFLNGSWFLHAVLKNVT